jgi:hypothetical protein
VLPATRPPLHLRLRRGHTGAGIVCKRARVSPEPHSSTVIAALTVPCFHSASTSIDSGNLLFRGIRANFTDLFGKILEQLFVILNAFQPHVSEKDFSIIL